MKIRLTHKRGGLLRPGKTGTDVSWFKFNLLELKQSTEFKQPFSSKERYFWTSQGTCKPLDGAELWELDDQG